MPLLLHIDTATEQASVCISREEQILGLISSQEQKNHAGFVQLAIQQLLADNGCTIQELDAIAVTAGPGSYTGLRVGLATAKGISYALQKPLILVNTLEVMARAVLRDLQEQGIRSATNTLLCPMIDARRMEVFTALYSLDLTEIWAPQALILENGCFSDLLANQPVIFSGSGHTKLKELVDSPNASYSHTLHNAADLAIPALAAYHSGQFANLAYSEPLYVKEFFDPLKKG